MLIVTKTVMHKRDSNLQPFSHEPKVLASGLQVLTCYKLILHEC